MKTTELHGFVRSDGRVGFRNLIAVIPLSGCAQQVAVQIAADVENAVALSQPLGCDLLGPDQDRLGQILYRLATHPNVGAALFVTMSCAATNIHKLAKRTRESGRPTEMLNIQRIGGTTACVRAGADAARNMSQTLREQVRQSVSISSIVLGTKCGASDKTSYETCNPVLGAVCDRLVDLGATVVLTEDAELYPIAEDLAERAVDAQTAQSIRDMAEKLRRNMKNRCNFDIDQKSGDPDLARRNSLARASKAGTRRISKVVPLGEAINSSGLVVIDGPNSDLVSITSLAACGCNLLAFTTGLGTPIACPVVPTIKVTANERTYEKMNENTDLLVKSEDLRNVDWLIAELIAYANGRLTKGELLGHGEMFIPLEGVTF